MPRTAYRIIGIFSLVLGESLQALGLVANAAGHLKIGAWGALFTHYGLSDRTSQFVPVLSSKFVLEIQLLFVREVSYGLNFVADLTARPEECEFLQNRRTVNDTHLSGSLVELSLEIGN